ncbi:g5693 [Coccomyxa elongata]
MFLRQSFSGHTHFHPPALAPKAFDMEKSAPGLVLKDLVLVGGGHSHVEVLRSFGMKPLPGVRLTLITKDAHTAYSGMLPGYVSGFYTHDECHVDLNRLARYAGAALILEAAVGLDLQKQLVKLGSDRPPIAYDALSLDIGITPSAQGVPGALQHATPVKPVSSFVERFRQLVQRLRSLERNLTVAVVGGGAGGVELALALQYRLHKELQQSGQPAATKVHVKLFCKGQLLQQHTSSARMKFLRIIKEKGVQLFEGKGVAAVEAGRLILDDGRVEAFDEALWCTQAAAPAWLAETGLPLDKAGFVCIDECLRAEGLDNVFAVGDVATSAIHPRPKAGVYAVRQGPPLTANLRRLLTGERLRPFVPQSTHLGLITTGDTYAVATKGWLCFEAAWLWTWKDRIDRAWMAKYGEDLDFDSMPGSMGSAGTKVDAVAAAAGPSAIQALTAAKMRCGGCGAKVGSDILTRVLTRLQQDDCAADSGGVVIGLGDPDDAAVVRPPPAGHVSVHTVDFFRAFIEDPYVFGAMAANHALGDCHAMGAKATSALAIAVVPYGLERKVEGTLHQMLGGALRTLQAAGCALIGGHTCEGAELSLGFSVNGSCKEGRLLRKGGLQPGQALILTKALGTGVIFAADMRGRAKGRWIAGALTAMQQSSEAAAGALMNAGATACTDVTGFGLLGHLAEMARASQVRVRLTPGEVPLLEGALDCARGGIASSLLPQNMSAAALVSGGDAAAESAMWPLLFDPQTAGGLLAGVPQEAAAACIESLRQQGYAEAAIVGTVLALVKGDDVPTDAARRLIEIG